VTKPSLPKILMTNLLLLVYLLIGSGLGNALLFCQESEDFSHLEYNLAGKCQDICLSEERSYGSGALTSQSPLAWSSADGCLDSSISLDHAWASGARDLLAEVVAPPLPAFHFSNHSTPSTDLVNSKQVARPPPSLALISLRTIVLLI